MKKIILLCFVSFNAFSQEKTPNACDITFGVKTGASFPKFSVSGLPEGGKATNAALTSFYAGLTAEIACV